MTPSDPKTNTLIIPRVVTYWLVVLLLAGCATGYMVQDTRLPTYAESFHYPAGCLPIREDKLKREDDRGKCLPTEPVQPAPGLLCQNWGMIMTCR